MEPSGLELVDTRNQSDCGKAGRIEHRHRRCEEAIVSAKSVGFFTSRGAWGVFISCSIKTVCIREILSQCSARTVEIDFDTGQTKG